MCYDNRTENRHEYLLLYTICGLLLKGNMLIWLANLMPKFIQVFEFQLKQEVKAEIFDKIFQKGLALFQICFACKKSIAGY